MQAARRVIQTSSADVVQAARRVYLRAIHACAGAAPLWHDGFAELGAALPPAEAAELLQLASDKGVASRTDVFEIQLAAATAAAGLDEAV